MFSQAQADTTVIPVVLELPDLTPIATVAGVVLTVLAGLLGLYLRSQDRRIARQCDRMAAQSLEFREEMRIQAQRADERLDKMNGEANARLDKMNGEANDRLDRHHGELVRVVEMHQRDLRTQSGRVDNLYNRATEGERLSSPNPTSEPATS